MKAKADAKKAAIDIKEQAPSAFTAQGCPEAVVEAGTLTTGDYSLDGLTQTAVNAALESTQLLLVDRLVRVF